MPAFPKVAQTLLKANYGTSLVAHRLSRACLVRPVAEGTDIGIDLYCEAVAEGQPFLHFGVQVKCGASNYIRLQDDSASFSFASRHLAYWMKQPMPVFVALVPLEEWPPEQIPPVYVVDVTSQCIGRVIETEESITLKSDFCWNNDPTDVTTFLNDAVPTASARLMCQAGVVRYKPSIRQTYTVQVPSIPVARFADQIRQQIRQTAALSIMFLLEDVNGTTDDHLRSFHELMSRVLEQFSEGNYEIHMARGISAHLSGQYSSAIRLYDESLRSINKDHNVCNDPGWRPITLRIQEYLRLARLNEPIRVPYTDPCVPG